MTNWPTLLQKRPRLIIPVDIAGIPCDYDKIFAIVKAKQKLFHAGNNKIQQALNRIIVVTDGAHAFGANWHGKMVGDIADFTSFSFLDDKFFTTPQVA
jgi:dTDP-4-amino-4,6-dideoxygalactose transaminase